MPELQIRVPYTAWGDGDEWQEGYEELLGDLGVALAESGVGDDDDADHQDDYIIFFAEGDDIDAIVRVVRPVLESHGVLSEATGFVTDPEADDFEVGTTVQLRE